MALENFTWVIPHKLAGSAIPGGFGTPSGEAVQRDLAELANQGIHTLVSLQRMPSSFEKLVEGAEMDWIHFPIPDFAVPPENEDFTRIIERVVMLMDEEKPVCAHCRAGVGRTGLFLCCVVGRYFRISGTQAVKTVSRGRPALDTSEQNRFVHHFCNAQVNA